MAGTMHLTPRERMLYALAQDEQWDGDVESPSDAFVGFWLDAKERNLIAAADDIDYGDVPKYWVVTEDNQGFLQFNDFTNAEDQQAFYDSRMAEYMEWCNDDDDENEPNEDDDIEIYCDESDCEWGYVSPDQEAANDALKAHMQERHDIEYPLADLGNLLTRIKADEDGPLALP